MRRLNIAQLQIDAIQTLDNCNMGTSSEKRKISKLYETPVVKEEMNLAQISVSLSICLIKKSCVVILFLHY